MTLNRIATIETILDQIFTKLERLKDSRDREPLIAGMQQSVKGKSDAEFIHGRARQAFPGIEVDATDPRNWFALFDLLKSKELRRQFLINTPEENAEAMERDLTMILGSLSNLGNELVQAGNRLSSNPVGRPPRMPPDEVCHKICDEIGRLVAGGLSIGTAQTKVALRRNLKVRMIQRIWARRKELFGL